MGGSAQAIRGSWRDRQQGAGPQDAFCGADPGADAPLYQEDAYGGVGMDSQRQGAFL
jgi:hypothetical protein